MTAAALLPSPLLPTHAYAPLVDALRPHGWAVVIATTSSPPDGPAPVLTAYRTCVERERPGLVLTHSNGGRYAALAAPGIPVVHIDAALPPASGEGVPMAPTAMLDRLAAMADDDGLLPPWSRWWPEEDLARVLPDPAARADLRDHEHRMPLSYFRSRLGAPPGWAEQPQAYLAFGDTYAEETAFARAQGWPTTVVEGALHLHHLIEPDAVATAVLDLATALPPPRVTPARGERTTG